MEFNYLPFLTRMHASTASHRLPTLTFGAYKLAEVKLRERCIKLFTV